MSKLTLCQQYASKNKDYGMLKNDKLSDLKCRSVSVKKMITLMHFIFRLGGIRIDFYGVLLIKVYFLNAL